jgi:YndJ-like protein
MSVLLDVLLRVVIGAGLLLVVPGALSRLADPAADLARRLWPIGAAAGALSLWLPRGPAATALATAYATAAAILAGYAASRPLHPRGEHAAEAAVEVALISPAVAAGALVAERSGYHLFGLGLPTLAATVMLVHLVIFATLTVTSLHARFWVQGEP